MTSLVIRTYSKSQFLLNLVTDKEIFFFVDVAGQRKLSLGVGKTSCGFL